MLPRTIVDIMNGNVGTTEISFIVLVLHCKDIQWCPSKADTIGTWFSVRYSEVSAVQMVVRESAHVLSKLVAGDTHSWLG